MKAKIDPATDISQPLGIGQSSNRGKRFKPWGLGLVGLALAGLAVIIIWNTAGKADSMKYKTQEVRRGSLTVSVIATGNLEPTNQVDVGSELSGIVRSVAVDYNDRVKLDQVLAKLDTDKLQAQVLQSKASLNSARAKVLDARATVKETRNALARLKQVRQLSNNKVPSQHDLDAAEAALDRALADEASAKAAVAEVQATLEYNQTDLSKAVVRSPINGVALERSVDPGQTVAASLTAPVLFTLAEDLALMELIVNVDEADVGQVKEGQEATFTVDAYPISRQG